MGELCYHSSPTDQNPPVRLSCGHAISRDAMKRLVNGHSGRYNILLLYRPWLDAAMLLLCGSCIITRIGSI